MESGMDSMKKDGFEKVKMGITTVQEVLEIAGEGD
jgi:type II secretory ATPase GspE/PulE/Tfp pilus assembly ATPase PilB-like protein